MSSALNAAASAARQAAGDLVQKVATGAINLVYPDGPQKSRTSYQHPETSIRPGESVLGIRREKRQGR